LASAAAANAINRHSLTVETEPPLLGDLLHWHLARRGCGRVADPKFAL
jgi:hypothetical protein